MEYRRPLPGDFEQIVELQNRNLMTALPPSERSDGFLSTAFSLEQFRTMDRELFVFVCVDSGKVVGYVGAGTVEFNKTIPRPRALLERCSQIPYKGKLLSSYSFFILGPVCIDKAYRGRGVFSGMAEKFAEMEHTQDLAIGFTPVGNDRLLTASKKVRSEVVGQFEAEGQTFWILVIPIQKRK